MTCSQWDVVIVPFPFVNQPGTKRRPALALSAKGFSSHGHTVLAMITTKTSPAWPGDQPIADHRAAGLRASCVVRLKLFTLDNRLIHRRIGTLAASDRARLSEKLRTHLPW